MRYIQYAVNDFGFFFGFLPRRILDEFQVRTTYLLLYLYIYVVVGKNREAVENQRAK